jgi:hypothetical protein
MRDGEKKQDRARMVREVHRLHTPVKGSDEDAHRDEEGCVESLLVISDDGPAELCVEISPSELLELVTTSSTANSKHVIMRNSKHVIMCMMTCLLCVHIVHFTLKQATSQRKRQICKDA